MVGAGARLASVVLCGVLGVAPLAAAQVVDRQFEPLAAEARARVRDLMRQDDLPGLAVAVRHQGRTVWSEGFGYAHLEHRVPVTSTTKFRVGSISKSLTSVAVGLLVEQGKLDLDAPVQRYVPRFPNKQYPITTRQLAGHVSGLPHYNADDIINRTRYTSVIHALDKFKDRPLLFEPGTRFAYSSFGWNLISAVVEGAAERPFLEYMTESVFRPLGMRHTVADQYDEIVDQRTAFYVVTSDGSARNAPAIDNSDVWAGGGFLSTADDLVRFGDALISSDLLRPSTVDLMFTSLTTNTGEATGYGLGWRLRDVHGRPTVGHGGSHVGARAALLIFPRERLVLAAVTNANSQNFGELVPDLALLLLEH